ncbi:hypothetical protein [Pseudomonas sp. LS-2]|uniref:hypothetical protein n=1 Tax=Pseudomonas sp. LS-2 TaxID=2315859 RepID=UPI000E73E1F8|nr:hypothetical protein [Pseudomonas sp. LS-2]RJX79977.1 hypothetical protein D3M70_13290 [Pseudomonas sp. LS-2]
MKKYWIIPAIAIVAIAGGMVYSMSTPDKTVVVQNSATFVDGTKITDVKFQPSDAADKHLVAVIKLVPGTEKGLSFAVHLNDADKKILTNVGDFPLATYCKGDAALECNIPIASDSFDKSSSLGIAAYKIPGQLMQVREGVSDWDDHRAIFLTKAP